MILYTHPATQMAYQFKDGVYFFKTKCPWKLGKPTWIKSGMKSGFVEVEAAIPGDLEAHFNKKHIKHLESDIESYQADIAGLEAALLAITKELGEERKDFSSYKKTAQKRNKASTDRINNLSNHVDRLRELIPQKRTVTAREFIKAAKLTAKRGEGARICREIAQDVSLSFDTVYNLWVKET